MAILKRKIKRKVVKLLPQIHRDHLRNARFWHGDSVEGVAGFHCAFVVGDDDKLGSVCHEADHFVVSLDVGFIQGGIYFVQNTERGGFDLENGEHKANRRECFFAA